MRTMKGVKKAIMVLGDALAGTVIVLLGLWPGYAVYQHISLQHVASDISSTRTISERSYDTPLASLEDKDKLLLELKLADTNDYQELNGKGILSTTSQADLEKIARDADPYIAKELQINVINRPTIRAAKLKDDTGGNYRLYGVKGINYIEVSNSDLYNPVDCRFEVIHESIHAQILAQPYYTLVANILKFWGERSSVLNEEYVQVATLEVLADQALDGDKLAEYTLLEIVNSANELQKESQIKQSLKQYTTIPLEIFLDAASGKLKSYKGLQLDGIESFARKTVIETKAKPNYQQMLETVTKTEK